MCVCGCVGWVWGWSLWVSMQPWYQCTEMLKHGLSTPCQQQAGGHARGEAGKSTHQSA